MIKGDKYYIEDICGGYRFKEKMENMGLRNGIEIEIVAIQPMGPVTINYYGGTITIGRGMFSKLTLKKKE